MTTNAGDEYDFLLGRDGPLLPNARSPSPPAVVPRARALPLEEIPLPIQDLLSKLEYRFRALVVVATSAYLIGVCLMMAGMGHYGLRRTVVVRDEVKFQFSYYPNSADIPTIMFVFWQMSLLVSCILLASVVPLVRRLYSEYDPAQKLARVLILRASWWEPPNEDNNLQPEDNLAGIWNAMYQDCKDLRMPRFGIEMT